MENQPVMLRFGWVSDNEVQPTTYASCSEAILAMAARMEYKGNTEAEFLAYVERVGFRLVLVEVSMKVKAFMCPYP